MSRRTPLPDGTYLDVTGDDPNWGVDSSSGRTARWDATAGVLADSEGKIIREVPNSPQTTRAQPRRAAGCKSPADGRFATLNAFVDGVARYLDDTDRHAWHVLFRHADASTSTAEVSIDTIAEKVARSPRSVIRAIEHLTKCKLIERLHRGRRQTGPSRYRIHTRPGECLERVRQLADARAAGKKPRRQRDTGDTLNGANRDEYGRFSNLTPATS